MLHVQAEEIRELDRGDIDAILGRHIIGRLAFVRGDRIDVIPVNYAYRGGSIYGRTAAGGKLEHIATEGTPVAFQVDEIRSGHDWRTVLVHGSFRIIGPETGEEAWMRALGAVRRLQKHALRREDPFPERSRIFRILVEQATGRAMG